MRAGATFQEVTAKTGIHQQRLHGLAEWNPEWKAEWKAEFDGALMAGRDESLRHGSSGAYRRGCRCPECREFKRGAR